MRKNYIVIGIFIICLCQVGYTGYYLGSKTSKPVIIENDIVTEEDYENIRQEIYQDSYNKGYQDGYDVGKVEVFEMLSKQEVEEDNVEIEETTKESESTNANNQNTTTSNIANNNQSYSITCEYCGATFTDSNEYLYHYQECSSKNATYHITYPNETHYYDFDSSDQSYLLECPFCNKQFSDINEYQQHTESHSINSNNDWYW